jgi:hypothetical protein
MNIRDKIAYADALLESQEREARARNAEFAARSQVDREARDAFLAHCRPATPKDYADWLISYFRGGGLVTHPRSYPMPNGWYVFCPSGKVAVLPPLCGALAISLIVPSGVTGRELVIAGGNSHNHLCFMDEFRPSGCVEMFTDVRDLLLAAAE